APTFPNIPVLLADAAEKRCRLRLSAAQRAIDHDQLDEARRELSAALALHASEAEVRRRLAEVDDLILGRAAAQKGLQAFRAGRWAEAAAQLGIAAQKDPRGQAAQKKLAEAQARHERQLMGRLRALVQARRYHAAATGCKEALGAAPYLQKACAGLIQGIAD